MWRSIALLNIKFAPHLAVIKKMLVNLSHYSQDRLAHPYLPDLVNSGFSAEVD